MKTFDVVDHSLFTPPPIPPPTSAATLGPWQHGVEQLFSAFSLIGHV